MNITEKNKERFCMLSMLPLHLVVVSVSSYSRKSGNRWMWMRWLFFRSYLQNCSNFSRHLQSADKKNFWRASIATVSLDSAAWGRLVLSLRSHPSSCASSNLRYCCAWIRLQYENKIANSVTGQILQADVRRANWLDLNDSIGQIAASLSLIHIWRCRRIERCRSRWSPYH